MNIEVKNGIAFVESDTVLISDVESALDLLATVQHKTESNCIAITKASVIEDFFDLSTRLAGEVLQKFVTYQTKLAIIGEYSHYTNKALRDFIYESNKGSHIFFVADEQTAITKLSGSI